MGRCSLPNTFPLWFKQSIFDIKFSIANRNALSVFDGSRAMTLSMESLVSPFDQLKLPNTPCLLHHAMEQLSIRGLVQSASWAAEILSALETSLRNSSKSADSSGTLSDFFSFEQHPSPRPSVTFSLAKSYFDSRQYRRVGDVLKQEQSSEGRFLRMYALYLAGERRKDEERMELADWSEPENLELRKLRDELEDLRDSGQMDAHLWYLFGVVLKRMRQQEAAKEALVRSIGLFPLNQGAWLELAPLCETRRCAEALKLPVHWMRSLFIGSILNDTEGSELAREIFEAFVATVPTCKFAKLQLATSLYHMRLFDEAQLIFDELYLQDEYCLDGVDIYSNILYVKEDKTQLSVLANKCIKVDKYRLETCCVIGNYYSLRGQHEEALSYFQRALRINRNYLSAWTLMGHEFLEMRNTAAAVEAYRRAVDINPKDFRAWYGLGQTYELLNMPVYTLYYYKKAAALRPHDTRMWCAVGQTLQELQKWDEAIMCFERAVGCEDREGFALSKLGSLYELLARECERDGRQHERASKCLAQAAKYYEANLLRREEQSLGGQPTVDALRFLAEYCMKNGDVAKARDYVVRLMDCPGHDKDFVKTLLRQVHGRQDEKQTIE